MHNPWFKRLRWFHVPVSIPGGILCLLTAWFWVQSFLAVDRHSHSASDTLFGVFPFLASSFLLLDWIASRTSR